MSNKEKSIFVPVFVYKVYVEILLDLNLVGRGRN